MSRRNGDQRIVVVAGIYRAATTWLFNAARILLEESGMKVWGGGTVEFTQARRESGADIFVIKEHRFIGWLAQESMVVLSSWRDEAEVAESWERFKGERPSAAQMKRWIWRFREWERFSDYTMNFDRLRYGHNPRPILLLVADALGVEDPDLTRVLNRLVPAMEPPPEEKDPHTLVFPNHFTSQSYESAMRHHHP